MFYFQTPWLPEYSISMYDYYLLNKMYLGKDVSNIAIPMMLYKVLCYVTGSP